VAIQFGLGGFPEFLTPNSLGNGGILLSRIPSVSELLLQSKNEIAESLNELNSFDHVVFRLSGENPNELVQLLRIYGLMDTFLDRSFSVSFWTMDSHHLGAQEARASRFFDHVFVAHKQYLQLFPLAKAFYLPCSFSLSSSADAAIYRVENAQQSSNKADGVCAPFAAYPWQKRNRHYADCLGEIKELGIEKVFFGVVRGGAQPNEAVIRKILEHKVVLNLSLSDDLNMRNFEALALNRILLTNRVKDHEILHEWGENIVYLNEDWQNLGQAIRKSLNRTPKDISKEFLVEHGIEARVMSIVEILSGHLREQKDVGFAGRRPSITLVPKSGESQNHVEIPHSRVDLLAKSGLIPIKSLLDLISESNNKWKTLWNFLYIWGESFGFHILKSTIGQSAYVRAVLRVVSKG